ncbi:hypothetical protein RMATCC62417_02335 [Rhizopus microsporus]|nr:hypothetical protein RMATCC62417_02335 [Rhizopus microsporus]
MGNHTSTLRKAKDVNNRDIQAQDTFRKIMVEYQDSAAVAEITATLNTKREFHNDETSTYWLPKDDKEQMRLTGQHFIFKELFGGNVLPRVSEVLDFEKGATILDVGCGSGVWVMVSDSSE